MCRSCSIVIDPSKKDQFAQKMMGHLNSAALTLMISLGHRTGLFDVMEGQEPSTSEEIAEAAGLNERYVREWLATMVTGGIIEYAPDGKRYHLPAEHSAWLTRESSPNNIAVTAQWVPVMAQVEDRIVESFRNGGGLKYEEYNRFHEVMADESGQSVVTPLLETLLPLVPGLKEKLERGIEVLDVGCGRGRALITLAEAFPKSNFTGYDLCQQAIDAAAEDAQWRKLNNIRFEVKDVAAFDEREKYDLITTFDAVHDQAQPARVLSNIYRALKSNGVYFCQDIAGSSHLEKNLTHPLGTFMYAISTTHCMSVSLARNGAGLGTMWGKELALAMMQEAGFKAIDVKTLEHDFINHYYIVRK